MDIAENLERVGDNEFQLTFARTSTTTPRQHVIHMLVNYIKKSFGEITLFNVKTLFGDSHICFTDPTENITAYLNEDFDCIDILGLDDIEFRYVVEQCGDRSSRDKWL